MRLGHPALTTTAAGLAAGVLLAAAATAPAAAHRAHHGHDHDHGDDHGTGTLTTVLDGLNGPRGLDALGHGLSVVTETDGTFSLVREHRHGPATKIPLGSLHTDFAPAVAVGHHGTVYLLTGGGPPPEEAAMSRLAGEEPAPEPAAGATLYRWRHGWDAPRVLADIGAYQATDPDPDDLEDLPGDSNPFGLAALPHGGVLVADAAGNDLLKVTDRGRISTVLRIKPRVVPVPDGLPDLPPEAGGPLPPAGTPIPSEGVATSVTVGPDGWWYVGELRGFPATPGTSQVWRVRPGTTDATCDPDDPDHGACRRWADGLTSIVDLAADEHAVYAVELSTASWLQVELGTPGAEVGSLVRLSHGHHGGVRQRELVPGQLVLPGGADASRDGLYVVGPVFGPGSLARVD